MAQICMAYCCRLLAGHQEEVSPRMVADAGLGQRAHMQVGEHQDGGQTWDTRTTDVSLQGCLSSPWEFSTCGLLGFYFSEI